MWSRPIREFWLTTKDTRVWHEKFIKLGPIRLDSLSWLTEHLLTGLGRTVQKDVDLRQFGGQLVPERSAAASAWSRATYARPTHSACRRAREWPHWDHWWSFGWGWWRHLWWWWWWRRPSTSDALNHKNANPRPSNAAAAAANSANMLLWLKDLDINVDVAQCSMILSYLALIHLHFAWPRARISSPRRSTQLWALAEQKAIAILFDSFSLHALDRFKPQINKHLFDIECSFHARRTSPPNSTPRLQIDLSLLS